MTARDAWPPLPLAGWRDTYATLHLWTQIVGKIRLATVPLVNHWWNVTLYVTPRGLSTGTMPHALILIFGDTVRALEAFDRHIDPDVPRIALVDTFKDEAEEALRVAAALGDRLWGIRLDTPSERGRVTASLVTEVRARLDQAGFSHVTITVSGGLNPDRIRYFKEEGSPVDSFAVGSYISGATPIDFTGDIKEIDGSPIAKRGRIPGRTESPRLKPVDLAGWREG